MRLMVLVAIVMLGLAFPVAAQTDDDRLYSVLPRDAIPAIDRPEFEPAATTRALANEEPVIGLVGERESRAYSTWQLDRHEIVNDVFEGRPVAVTWCPLCGTGIVYSRVLNGRVLTFGVSGMLYRDALVMYDRETGTLWSQIDGRGIKGSLEGAQLEAVPAVHALWHAWRTMYPQSEVLKKGWGQTRSGYEEYNRGPELGLFRRRNLDARLPGKTSVLGIASAGAAVVFPVAAVREAGLAQARVGGVPVVVAGPAGQPLLAFDRRVAGRLLDFAVDPRDPSALRDTQTGTRWQLRDGQAVDGPLTGQRLQRVVAHTAFWFGWYGFYPGSAVWSPER